jgi:hypothetical protein
MQVLSNFNSARSAARQLGRPLSQILKAIHAGIISPAATSSGQLIVTPADFKKLQAHFSPTKTN